MSWFRPQGFFTRPVRSLLGGLLLLGLLATPVPAGGNQWTTGGPGEETILSLAIDPSNPATIYAGGSTDVFKTTNGGASWEAVNSDVLNVRALAVDPSAPATIYAGTGNGIFKTVDGGGDWRPVGAGILYPIISALAIDPSAPATIYAGIYIAGMGGAYKSMDGGERWTVMSLASLGVLALAVDPSVPTTLYAGSVTTHGRFGGVLKSVDGGDTWRGTGLTDIDACCLSIDPSAPSTLYTGASFLRLSKSTDGGATWMVGLTDFGVSAIVLDPANPSRVFAGSHGAGVFVSHDGGASWSPLNEGLSDLNVTSLAIDSTGTTLHAGTDGSGVFDYTFLPDRPVIKTAPRRPAPRTLSPRS